MTETSLTQRILAFSAHIGRPGDPAGVARRRAWIDADGAPTIAGRELVEALEDQSTTRTVFRGNF